MTVFYITSIFTCMFAFAGAIGILYIAANIDYLIDRLKDEKITNKKPKHAPGIIYIQNYASDIIDVVVNTLGEYGLLSDKFYDSDSKDSIDAYTEAYDESFNMVGSMVNEVTVYMQKGAMIHPYKYSESGKRYEEFESKNY